MSEEENEKIEIVKKKTSLGKKLLKGILYLFLFFTFISILLVILAQFRFFRNFALENTLKFVNNELIAKIEIDDLTFFDVQGIHFYGVRLIADGDTLANVPELIIDVNYELLFDQKVTVNRVIFKNPTIRLLRNSVDSLWNYDKIALSTDTTTTGPSPWVIDVKKLELRDGTFLRYDSTISYINYAMMDYDHISLDNFNLVLSAKVKLETNDFYAEIRKLNGFENYSRMRIQDISTKLILNPEIIAAKDFKAKLNESDFEINVEMTKFNVFDTINPPDIEKAHFYLDAKGLNIEDSVIQKFASIPIKFGKSANIWLDATGTLSKMSVKRVNLETGNSDIKISGELKSLLDMDKFEYEFSLDDTKITRKDILDMLSNLDLKDIPEFGDAYTKRLYVKGFIDSVYMDADIKTKIGHLIGKAGVNYASDKIKYFADFNVKNLYLSPLTKSVKLDGILNGRIAAKGSGTDLNNIKVDLVTNLYDSQIYGTHFKKFQTGISGANKKFRFDSLYVEFPRSQNILPDDKYMIYDDNKSYITLSGNIDFNDMKKPIYELDIKLNGLNFKEILDNKTLPDYLTGDFSINASGIDPDSLEGDFSGKFEEMSFTDRAFFPFSINANLKRGTGIDRNLVINSDLIDLEMSGSYRFSDLFDGIVAQGKHVAEYVVNKLESFNPKNLIVQDSVSKHHYVQNITEFPDVDAKLKVNITDLSPLNIFIDSISIYSGVSFEAVISSNKQQSIVFIDSLKLVNFAYKSSGMNIKTLGLRFQSSLITTITDSKPKIELLTINMDNTQDLRFNDLELDSAYTNLAFDGNNLDYSVGSFINNYLRLYSKGKLEIGNSFLKLNADSIKFSFNNTFFWNNTKPVKINSSLSSINIEDFSIERKAGETIFLKGAINDDKAKDIVLDISNLPVTDFLPLAGEAVVKQFAGMKFNIDTLRVRINGDLKKPKIITSIFADSLVLSNYKIGNINGRLIHNETYIHGYFDVITPLLGNKKTLNIDVNYLPVYLGTNSEIPFMNTKKSMDIRLKAMAMPLELLKPFAVGLSELSGFIDANLVVEGNIDDGLVYSGTANSTKTRLRVENTNIAYNAELNVDFNKDKVTLTKVLLKNIPEDERFGRLGKAEVTGTVDLDGFDIGNLDIYVTAERLLVMSDATMVTMPDMYGDFIISTDNIPLRFYGPLDKPNLDGNVNIYYAHLKMPMETKKSMVRTYLTYRRIGDIVRVQSTTVKDSTISTKHEKKEGIAPSIADLINYNLSAKILGQFIVEMDMNLIGSMYAVIATSDKTRALRYVKDRNDDNGKLFGEVVVKDQSTIKSWKQFTTSGVINFPTGSIENPLLDLSATHTGTMMENGMRKQFIVKMYITGFKDNPKVSFKYYIDQIEGTGSQEQINEDALYLLTLGRTKSGSGGSLNNSIFNEGMASGVSNFATKALSELLMTTGVIQSAEFDFQGGAMNLGEATLRLSGQLYGGISWTVGGTVADLSSNNQITIDIPASEFSNNPFWSNFVLQLSKASNNNVLANSQDAKNWEVKIKLGSSW
jgi:hypothetical protein